MVFKLNKFEDLTVHQLYDTLRLRQEVFVLEQYCVYLDCDGLDQNSYHLLGLRGGAVVACSRIAPPGLICPGYVVVGRVVLAKNLRGTGLGDRLMQLTLEACNRLFPNNSIRIHAQAYLERFYQRAGFVQQGDQFYEDGIPHIPMIWKPNHATN